MFILLHHSIMSFFDSDEEKARYIGDIWEKYFEHL